MFSYEKAESLVLIYYFYLCKKIYQNILFTDSQYFTCFTYFLQEISENIKSTQVCCSSNIFVAVNCFLFHFDPCCRLILRLFFKIKGKRGEGQKRK